MAIFASTEKMYEVLGELFRHLAGEPGVVDTLASDKLVIKFNISEPNGEIWLLPSGEVICGGHDGKPVVEMTLGGDTCHKFWLQQIKMPVALAKGLIKAKGPMPKVLKLMPLLKPAYAAYPAIATKAGLAI